MLTFNKYKNKLVVLGCILILSITRSFVANASAPLVLQDDMVFYPYSYLKDGKPSGLYNDITALAIARTHEGNTQIKLDSWQNSLKNVQSGKAQGLIGTYMLPIKRPWLTHYSEPIFQEEIIFICAAKHQGKSLKRFPEDFKNMLIVNIADFDGWLNYEARDEKYTSLVNFFEAPSVEIAFQMVQKGNVDCSIFERMSFEYFMKKHKLKTNSKDAPFVAMTFKKDFAYVGFNAAGENKQRVLAFKTAFDKALQQMKENGEIEVIKAKYIN